MRKLTQVFSVFLFILIALSSTPNVKSQTINPDYIPTNVILISWDGLDRSVVEELLSKNRLPNLAKLINEGSYRKIEIVGHPTCTKPSHAEMLTGLSAEKTGVFSNRDYKPIPEGYSIFERVQEHLGGKDKIRTIMVAGKLANIGGRSPEEIKAQIEKIKNKQNKKKAYRQAYSSTVLNHGEPFYLTKKSLDVFDVASRNAQVVGQLSLKYLEQFKEPRFLAFIHFSDPDHMGHKHSMASEEYRQAAVDCDKWLGEIINWLKNQNLYDKTLIYVTTDHGFDKDAKTHGNAPHGWLATNDKAVKRDGFLADIPATILWRFGVNLENLDPKLIGKPLV